jgi:hypothetical protein
MIKEINQPLNIIQLNKEIIDIFCEFIIFLIFRINSYEIIRMYIKVINFELNKVYENISIFLLYKIRHEHRSLSKTTIFQFKRKRLNSCYSWQSSKNYRIR